MRPLEAKIKRNKIKSKQFLIHLRSFYIFQILVFLLVINFTYPITLPASAEVESEVLGSGLGRFNAVAAEDIDDDGRCEIVVGNYEGYVIVMEYRDFDFHEEWRSKKLGHRMWGIIVADFLGDSTKEIIAGNGDGDIYIFDGKSHKQVWHATDLVRDVHGLLVHDLGSTDTKYLLAGTGYKNDKDLGTVYIFTADSTEPIAEIGQFENRMRGLGVGDLDGDGKLELALGSGVATGERPGEGYVRVYDIEKVLTNDQNALEWKSENLKGDCVAIELADFNGDDNPDIVVGNGYRYQAGWVRVFTYDQGIKNFTEYWKSQDIGPKPYGLAVDDLDSDNQLDIVVGNQPGYIYVFEQTGTGIQQVWKSSVLGTDILGVDIEDVDNDGQLEIVATQGGYIGKGDYTSAYSEPHIYIIDGKTHEIEIKVGETHPLGFILEISILILFILLLLGLNYYLKFRKRVKDFKTSTRARTRPVLAGTPISTVPESSMTRSPVRSTAPQRTITGPIPTPKPKSAFSPSQTPVKTPAKTPISSSAAPAPMVNDPFAKPPDVNDPFTKSVQLETTKSSGSSGPSEPPKQQKPPVVNDPFAKPPEVNDPFKPLEQENKQAVEADKRRKEGGKL
jgi:hypothetical protein